MNCNSDRDEQAYYLDTSKWGQIRDAEVKKRRTLSP
jgi:hypothetical protein